jgi:hypothetical protein
MNLISPPPVSRGGDQPSEDVDRRLRAFFRAQMPDPWPSLEASAPRPATIPFAQPPRRGGLFRSRLALAASVALLAMGLFAVAEAFQGRPATPSSASFSEPPKASVPRGPDQTPVIPTGNDKGSPSKLKVNESLIQEPDGTKIKVEVIDWPVPPK